MNEREITELAAWTAKSIRDTLAMDGRVLDSAGEDIIREYVQTDLRNWQRGEVITVSKSMQLVNKILEGRRHETKTLGEVLSALEILATKFSDFVENNRREREVEAKRLASQIPAIRV